VKANKEENEHEYDGHYQRFKFRGIFPCGLGFAKD
jgi:hypothetical protein